MTTRQGVCPYCGVEVTLVGIKEDWDANRFYWGETIICPICNLKEIVVRVVP